ncbi:hypothetical protein GINT2_001393 [Glugoides intestinalis]
MVDKKMQKEATKEKYNEGNVTRAFLRSEKGFKFLLKIGKMGRQGTNAVKEVDKLIDLFSTWTNSFPVRKNLKVSKYEFLKSVEDFCLQNENVDGIFD